MENIGKFQAQTCEGKYRNSRMPANTANTTLPVEKLVTRSLWGVPGDRWGDFGLGQDFQVLKTVINRPSQCVLVSADILGQWNILSTEGYYLNTLQ